MAVCMADVPKALAIFFDSSWRRYHKSRDRPAQSFIIVGRRLGLFFQRPAVRKLRPLKRQHFVGRRNRAPQRNVGASGQPH